MATVKNSIDKILQAAGTRTVNMPGTTAADWTGAAVAAATAKAAADAAQADATAANDYLLIVTADNQLSKNEKPAEILRWNTIVGEYSGIQAQADALSVSRTSFDSAYSTLNSYLTSINSAPAWTDVLVDTPITGTTFRTNFLNYNNAKAALLKAIADKIQANAAAAQTAAATSSRSVFSPYKTWEFRGTTDGWTSVGMSSFAPNVDSVTATSNGTDPIIRSPTNLNFSGKLYDKVRARVKRTGGAAWDGNLYFVPTTGEVEGALGSSWVADTTVNGQWVIVEWDMSALVGWTGKTIEHIRIDLGASAADVFEIDWISIGKLAPAVSNFDMAAVQAQAQVSTDAIDVIGRDDRLSRGEKPAIVLEMQQIIDEHSTIDTSAANMSITTERTNWQAAYTTLYDYMAGLSPYYTDTTQDTVIVAATWKTNFANYYLAKAVLVNAIAAKAAFAPSAVIGGANLYPDGGFERGIHPCTEQSGCGSIHPTGLGDAGLKGSSYLFFDGTATDIYLYLGGPITTVVPGKTYMLSFYYKNGGNVIGSSTYFRYKNAAGAVNHVFFNIAPNFASEWVRAVMPWTAPAGIISIEPRFGMNTGGTYSWMAVDCIQIEEGNKETQWTPAQVDVAADAQAKADVAIAVSANINLTVNSNITLTGNTAVKSLSNGWDGQVATLNGYNRGAFAEAKVIVGDLMFGLNTDPFTDAHYASIDHAIYASGTSSGTLQSYRNGTWSNIGSWTSGDVFMVAYLGNRVSYQQNGTEIFSIAESEGRTFYFDSSFATIGAKLTNIRFGPMTAGTVGAPAGTQVNGVPVETLTSQASAGAAAQTVLASTVHGHGSGSVLGVNNKGKSGSGILTFDARTAVGGGGVGPYTYSWEISGDVLDAGEGFYIDSGEHSATLSLKCLSGTGLVAYYVQAICTIYDSGSSRIGYEYVDHNATYS